MLTKTPVNARIENYIFPPRTTNVVQRESTTMFAELGWIAQYKYNDSRTLIRYLPNGNYDLWNRHGSRLAYKPTDKLDNEIRQLRHTLGLAQDNWSLIDGGTLDAKHRAIKNTIVIWDILVQDGQHLYKSTYQARYTYLLNAATTNGEKPWLYQSPKHEPVEFGLKYSDSIFIPRNFKPGTTQNPWAEQWETIEKVNKQYQVGDKVSPVLEGLVFKNLNGTLKLGHKEKNNEDWLAKSRVQTGRHHF